MGRTNFSKLTFGETSAEAESEKNPQLFFDSFWDFWDIEDEIQSGNSYLVIGPKGSGKSSIAEYMRVKSELSSGGSFTKLVDLGSLHQSVGSDKTLGEEKENHRTELAWTLLIYLKLYESLMEDNSSSIANNPDHMKLKEDLKKAGLLSGDFKSVIYETKKRRHKFTLPKVYNYESESESTSQVNVTQLVDFFKESITDARTENSHLLALDGLDSAMIGNVNYWVVLANLLRATNSVHRTVRKNPNVRILILCRSDILLKVPLPDQNKIRQDWGVELNWEFGTDNARDSFLWDLVERKVRTAGAQVDNILDDYFPAEMTYGNNNKSPMATYLMQLTRQTPRDILSLLRFIAKNSRHDTGSTLQVRSIRAGVNDYGKNYFVGEITDELAGLVPNEVSTNFLGGLSRLGSYRRFERKEFDKFFSQKISGEDFDTEVLLRQLYLAGAIANIDRSGRTEYVQFYHRRNHVDLDPRGPFLLHPALALGFNKRF